MTAVGPLAAALAATIATEFRVLPDVVDFTLITNAAGLGALLTTVIGAALRLHPDRIGRLTLLGTVVGAVLGTVLLVIGLIAQ